MSDYIGYQGFPGLDAILSASKTSLTVGQAAATIARDGAKWGSPQIGTAATVTYSFPDQNNGVWTDERFEPMHALQMKSAENALKAWSDVANVRFQRVGSGYDGPDAYSMDGQIKIQGFRSLVLGAGGMSQQPGTGSVTTAVFTPEYLNDASYYWQPDGLGRAGGHQTLLHELGHAIGLEHPTEYGSLRPTYEANAGYREDSQLYSVMSYFEGGRADAAIRPWQVSSTPGIHDIAAAQLLYGANTATRTGDTTYGFNSNADESYFRITNSDSSVNFAVWDAGGNDTFDFSGFHYNHVIDLREGAFSSVSDLNPAYNRLEGYNVSIAYGTVIENAIGGEAGEMIIGNDAANRLVGNGGHDLIRGGAGADTIDGGDGNDHLYGQSEDGGADGADLIIAGSGADYVNGNAGADTIYGGDGSDRLYGGRDDDLILGEAGNDVINGNKGADTIRGGDGNDVVQGGQDDDLVLGEAGNDILCGNLGNDVIAGGTGFDVLIGGPGADVFRFDPGDAVLDYGTGTADVILDFEDGVDHLSLGYAPSRIILGGAIDTVSEAAFHARAAIGQDAHAVAVLQVGGDAVLFYGSATGPMESIRLDGIVNPGQVGYDDFI